MCWIRRQSLPTKDRRRDDDPVSRDGHRDGIVRAFYNVCQHRGTAVAEEPCGTVVRLQCPYHAWIYDLEGNLIRAKHTDDLAEFDFGSYGLRPVRLAAWGGFVNRDAYRLGRLQSEMRTEWKRAGSA